MTAKRRRTYRVNADSWTVLRDILVGTPDEFNPDTATIKGRTVKSVYPHTGRLSGESEDIFRDDRAHNDITYVVYSYSTPIAWRVRSGMWRMPHDKYSVTTSKHQGKVRTALSQVSGGI